MPTSGSEILPFFLHGLSGTVGLQVMDVKLCLDQNVLGQQPLFCYICFIDFYFAILRDQKRVLEEPKCRMQATAGWLTLVNAL